MPTTAATVTAAIAGSARGGEDFVTTSSLPFGADVGLICSSSSLVYCIDILMINGTEIYGIVGPGEVCGRLQPSGETRGDFRRDKISEERLAGHARRHAQCPPTPGTKTTGLLRGSWVVMVDWEWE